MHRTEKLGDEADFSSVDPWPFAKFFKIGALGTLHVDKNKTARPQNLSLSV